MAMTAAVNSTSISPACARWIEKLELDRHFQLRARAGELFEVETVAGLDLAAPDLRIPRCGQEHLARKLVIQRGPEKDGVAREGVEEGAFIVPVVVELGADQKLRQ